MENPTGLRDSGDGRRVLARTLKFPTKRVPFHRKVQRARFSSYSPYPLRAVMAVCLLATSIFCVATVRVAPEERANSGQSLGSMESMDATFGDLDTLLVNRPIQARVENGDIVFVDGRTHEIMAE